MQSFVIHTKADGDATRVRCTRVCMMPVIDTTDRAHTRTRWRVASIRRLACVCVCVCVWIKTNKRRRRHRPVFTLVHIDQREGCAWNRMRPFHCGDGSDGARLSRHRRVCQRQSSVENSTTHKIVSETHEVGQRRDDVTRALFLPVEMKPRACVCIVLLLVARDTATITRTMRRWFMRKRFSLRAAFCPSFATGLVRDAFAGASECLPQHSRGPPIQRGSKIMAATTVSTATRTRDFVYRNDSDDCTGHALCLMFFCRARKIRVSIQNREMFAFAHSHSRVTLVHWVRWRIPWFFIIAFATRRASFAALFL